MENKAKQNPFKRLLAIRGMGQVITVTCGLIILCIVFGVLNPIFGNSEQINHLKLQGGNCG